MKKLLYVVMAVVMVQMATSTPAPAEDVMAKVTVRSGQTLWHLVGKEMERVGDKRDIREVIYETRKHNNIGPMLNVGDVIEIPLKASK